jgi:putative FmdB family regulatory protein
MPIYEYKCENGHIFDVMQRMSDDPLTECRVCGAPVRKVLRPVGISFKGSGFYSTDYSRSNGKGDSKEATKTEASTNGSSEKNGSSGTSEKKSDTSSAAAKGGKSGD